MTCPNCKQKAHYETPVELCYYSTPKEMVDLMDTEPALLQLRLLLDYHHKQVISANMSADYYARAGEPLRADGYRAVSRNYQRYVDALTRAIHAVTYSRSEYPS